MTTQCCRRSTLGWVPDGPPGTRVTLRLMADAIRGGRTMQIIRMTALRIVAGLPGKDYRRELDALRRWVRHTIRYTRDVHTVETVQTPEATLSIRHGDCDDQAVLLGALAESIGFRTRLVAIGPRAMVFQHVYLEAQLPGGRWTSAETTEDVPLGWAPPWPYRMVQRVS